MTQPPQSDRSPRFGSAFVGREAELERLKGAFEEATASKGSLFLVVGEPGIGKTTLTEQLAAHVAEAGGRTLVGHCYEEGSLSLPYLAFVEAMRSHVLTCEPEQLREQLGTGAGHVARIVTEVRDRLDVELAPSNEPEEDRYRLMLAVSDFLARAAADQPTLVVLEDLHDADRATLDLLVHVTRNLAGTRLLLVGTYRDVEVDRAHPLASALAELRRVSSLERISLRGLTPDEVHRMLEAIAMHQVPWRWAEVVHRQTEGNPLFIQEVMRYLVEEGVLARDEGELTRVGDEPLAGKIPEGLRDVIGKRMTRLSTACNRVLAVAAVIGREFRMDVLERVAAVESETLLAALEEARNAAVIEERAAVGTGVTYRFAHAFFRQTLYEETIAPRRLRLHQQVGRALEEVHARRPEEHAAELAEHFAQSTDAADLTKAVHYSELAAGRAMGVYAYGEAARLLEQALQVQEVVDPDDRGKRCELLLMFGEALMPAGEPRRVSEEVAEQALALAEQEHDQPMASRACTIALIAINRYAMGGTFSTTLRRWAERADHHALPGTVDRVYADISLAVAQRTAAPAGSAYRETAQRAWDLARQLDDSGACFFAARLFITMPVPPKYHAQRIEVMDELLKRPRHGVNPRTVAAALHHCGFILFGQGDREGAEALWRELEELASRTRDPSAEVYVLLEGVHLAYIDGRLEEAAARRERLLTRSDELGSPFLAYSNSFRTALSALVGLGRTEEALALLDATESRGTEGTGGGLGGVMGNRSLAIATMSGRSDDVERALAEAWSQVDSDETDGGPLITALEAAILVGDTERTEALSGYLSTSAALAIEYSPFLISPGRLLGEAAVLRGRPEEAHTYYGQALDVCTRVRFRPEVALTRLDLAGLLLDHYADERAEAEEHLDSAIAELREMKMAPALERALALKERIASKPSKAPAHPDGLTDREVEVLVLVSAGKTDREIAKAMVISTRTASTHVSNILNKISAANRTEAAVYATRLGLS